MHLALIYHNDKTKAITIFWNVWMLKSALHQERENWEHTKLFVSQKLFFISEPRRSDCKSLSWNGCASRRRRWCLVILLASPPRSSQASHSLPPSLSPPSCPRRAARQGFDDRLSRRDHLDRFYPAPQRKGVSQRPLGSLLSCPSEERRLAETAEITSYPGPTERLHNGW